MKDEIKSIIKEHTYTDSHGNTVLKTNIDDLAGATIKYLVNKALKGENS